jgi:bifunctional DNase/RNase
MKLVDLFGLHVEATSGTPLVLLREHDAPHRVIPIMIGNNEAAAIALGLGGDPPPRPLTHDLMAALVESLDGRLDAVEVTEVRDGAFIARLDVTGPTGDQHLDTRPSDAIALAVRLGAPLYVSDDVLDTAGAILRDADEEEAIEEVVEEFRGFLDDLDPADFESVAPTDDHDDDQ